MSYEQEKAMTSIQKSLTLLTLDEEDKKVVEFVFNSEWGPVRDLITERGKALSLKLVCVMCSVGPPQSVVIAMGRANSRIFAEIDGKGRHPLHYLCYHGAPTFAIVYAAQCHIAALEVADANKKTPLEYLMTMPWDYCKEDKETVILELQKCSNLKCYNPKSKLPNDVALKRWGHKVVIEDRIKCFGVFYIECARVDNPDADWDGCCLSNIAGQISEKCHDVVDEFRKGGKFVRVDAYHLSSNKFVLLAKTKSQDDCEEAYKSLCQKHLGALKHCGIFLRIGCVYCMEVIGPNTISELLIEAEKLQNKVKQNLASAATTISMTMEDTTGEKKINVSALTESHLKDFTGKDFYPDFAVSSSSLDG